MVRSLRYVLLALAAFGGLGSSSAASFRTVAYTGQAAPGSPPAVFVTFTTSPHINDAGRVDFGSFDNFTEFGAQYATSALWSEGSGALVRLVDSDDDVPGYPPGVHFGRFLVPVLNDAGDLAFVGTDNYTIMGIWRHEGGLPIPVAVISQQAPGTATTFGSDLTEAFFSGATFNESGRTAFTARIRGGDARFPSDNSLWTDSGGALQLLARTDRLAPAIPPAEQIYISSLNFAPLLNDGGTVAFIANLSRRRAFGHGSGLFVGAPGALRVVAKYAQQAHGLPANIHYSFMQSASLNANSEAAWSAGLQLSNGFPAPNATGIWAEHGGAAQLVAREGEQAPGAPAGTTFGPLYSSVVYNAGGHIAFNGYLRNPGSTSIDGAAIWAGPYNELAMIARTGQAAPGAGGAAFASFDDLQGLALNRFGQIAFLADLDGQAVSAANNTGLWATTRTGELQLVLREGDELEVAPGLFKTVREIRFAGGSNNEDGRPSSFNNLGQIAFRAVFTDFFEVAFEEGLFVSKAVAVPEPSGALLLAAFTATRIARRRPAPLRPRAA